MTKEEFIRKVDKETRLGMREVADVVNASHRVIEELLRKGDYVVFPGFGAFDVRERQGGKVKHVRTGKVVSYPKRIVPYFTPGKYLKNAANGKRRR